MLAEFYSDRKKLLKIFTILEGIASKGDAKYKMAAAVVRGKIVIGVGPNRMNSGPRFVRDNYFQSKHCEYTAIRDALAKSEVKVNGDIPLGEASRVLRGSTIYVFRQWKNGHPALARPCVRCQERLLRPLGFKKMIYTTSESPSYYQESPL